MSGRVGREVFGVGFCLCKLLTLLKIGILGIGACI